MHSNNLGCIWQLILLAVVIYESDIASGDLENFQTTTATATMSSSPSNPFSYQIKRELDKQFVDLINTNDVGEESTSSGVILQPPPPSPPPRPLPTKTTIVANNAKMVGIPMNTKYAAGTTSSSVEPTKSSLSTSSATSTASTTKDKTSSYIHTKAKIALTTDASSTDDEFPLKIPTTATTTTRAENKIPAMMIGTSTSTLSIDYYYEYASTTTVPNEDAATLLHPPSSDSLTKGFTIPTFLPPVREFAVADLPSYITTTTTTKVPTTSADDLELNGDQLFFSPNSRRKNSMTFQSPNVSVQLGNHAYMPCSVHRIQSKPVSWVRVRDGHIISVDQTTFIADQRFQAIYNEDNEHSWSLQIKYVQESDEGWYECQVSTEPKMSSKIYLEVVVPKTELIGDQNRFVKAGSKVALHCIVRGTIVPPTYIIWFREKSQITDDNTMGWYTQIDRNIFGNVSDNENTIGSLIIPSVRKKDSGNFTCQPSNSESVSVDLHVLSGEYSASAIMSDACVHRLNWDLGLIIILIVFVLVQHKT